MSVLFTFNGIKVISTPANPAPKSFDFTIKDYVAASDNPFGPQQQICDWGNSLITIGVQLPPMKRNYGSDWSAFLMQCRGMSNAFLIGDPTGKTPRGSNLTSSGDSIALTTAGNGYNTQIFTNSLDGSVMPSGSFASLTDLTVDIYIYIPSSSSTPQALEGPDVVLYTGSHQYYPSIQADAYSGMWRIWNSGGGAWVSTGHSCATFLATKDVWQHLRLHSSINQGANTMTYQDFWVNDVPVFQNLGTTYSGEADSSPAGMKAQVQIDGSTVGSPSTTIYYDQWNVNAWDAGLGSGSGAPLYPNLQTRGSGGFTVLGGTTYSGGSNTGTGSATYHNTSPGIGGSPLIDGANQVGYYLRTKRWQPNAQGVLKRGDWIQIIYRLHKVLDDVNADASGNATIAIYPPIRETPADGQTIITTNTVGLFRLASSTNKFSITEAEIYGFNFDIREAI